MWYSRMLPWAARANGLAPVTSPEHQIVHSSRGRLRVHLPRWTGLGATAIEGQLQGLTGVTRVTANGLTGNVLILFEPRQTNPDTLLAALRTLSFDAKPAPVPAPTPVVIEPVELSHTQPPTGYVTGVRRVLYHMLGWASVVMAIIGAILPGIPTAPFVILAGYFFIRSSPTAHQWLRESRWFGAILRDWEEHHGISRRTRNVAVGLILVSAALCSMLGLPLPLLLSIYAMQLIGLIIVLRLRVVDHPELALELVGV